MSADQVVIVAGSRTLADDPRAVAWARGILARELASATLVVAGDARGPDVWAYEIARGMVAPIDCECWRTIGSRHGWTGGRWRTLSPWATPETTTDPHRRPLVRNAAMVQYYTRAARMVALIDPAFRTQGTQHTVTLARAAGIDVTEHVWRAS